MKKIILTTILAVLSIIIFMFSNQAGSSSINTSDKFASKVIDKVYEVTNKEITPKEKKKLIIKTRFIVRKIAHFTLYFTLGLIVYLLLLSHNVKHSVILSIIICFLFGCVDEIHQYFVPGRTARVYDCIVDTLGSMTSIYLVYFSKKIKSLLTKKESVQ